MSVFLPLPLLSLLIFTLSCSDFIKRDNPLDEHNPTTKGDPIKAVDVEQRTNAIEVTWNAVHMPDAIGEMQYVLGRQEDIGPKQGTGGPWAILQHFRGETSYLDESIMDGVRYRYGIQLRTFASSSDGFGPKTPTSPWIKAKRDQDEDGVRDASDDDVDGDSFANALEIDMGSDPNDSESLPPPDLDDDGISDPLDSDLDGDRVDDLIEQSQGSDPRNKDSVPPDLDEDGIYDFEDVDKDGDGVDDRIERE